MHVHTFRVEIPHNVTKPKHTHTVYELSLCTHKDVGALVVVDGLIPVESRRVAVAGCQT